MKQKLTLLLLALVTSLGAWATVTMPTLTTDPLNPVLYCIQSYRAYTFVQYSADDAAMTPNFDFTNANTKFYFVAVNGTDYSEGVKIVSNVNGKQVDEMTGFADTGTTWYLGESTYATGCFNISTSSSFTDCWDCNGSGVMTADYWNPNTEGSTWQIMSVDDLPQYQVSTIGSPKWYYLKTGRDRYVYADGTNAGTNTTNPKTDAYKFAFISTGNHGVNIVSKAGLDGGSNQYLSSESPYISNDAATWYYYNAVRSTGYFVLSDINNGIGYPHLLNDNGNGGLAKWYVDSSPGSYFQVEEVLPVCDVTYTYTYGGNTYSETETQNIGDPVSLPASINFPYTSYSFDTDVVPDAGTATVNVTVTGFSMPFTVSTDYASATWYYLNGHATYSDCYVSTSGTNVVWSQGKGITEAYQWAFIGNPIDGIKIINKAAGSTYFLQETDPLTMATTDKSWTIKQQTNTSWNSGANGFGLWSEVNSKYVNTQGSALKYWGSFDQGSTFWVEAVPDDYASNVAAEIKPWFDNYGGNFQLKTAVVEANQTKYNAALVSCDLTTYEELLDLIADPDNFVYPSTGFYRIKSVGARAVGESYIAYGKSSNNANYGLITKAANAANQDATTLFYINKQGNGKYTMAIQGLNVQAASQSAIVSATAGAAQEYTFIPSSPGYAAMTVNGGTYEFLHEAGWTESGHDYNGVVGWTASAGASQWTVEEVSSVSVNLNSDGAEPATYYATFCAPFSYTVSSGTKAYTLTASGEWLVPAEVDGAVPAGTPVLLKGSSSSATLTISGTDYVATPLTTTALTGTYLAKTIDGANDYVLGKDEGGVVGFYHWNTNSLGANRAYYDTPAADPGVKGYVLKFDEDATGLEGVQDVQEAQGAIYNLAGQRLNKIQKGINIVNGKKILK